MDYDGAVPGTAVKAFAEVFPHWLDEATADEERRDWARAHAVLRTLERLVHDLDLALQHNELLRSQLQEARIEIDFLRRQVDQLSEALKTNRRSVTRAMLAGVGMILLAVVTGGAEATTGHLLSSDAEAEESAEDFLQRCDDLVNQLDKLEMLDDSWPERRPTG